MDVASPSSDTPIQHPDFRMGTECPLAQSVHVNIATGQGLAKGPNMMNLVPGPKKHDLAISIRGNMKISLY